MSEAATIFALASGAGRAGVAVIRISGPAAGAGLTALTGRDLPAPRSASRRRLAHSDGQPLDDALALWFPAPASFTGEDVVELHVHGCHAVIAAVAQALIDKGFRLAGPGEFSRRAFENGKLDLTAAEGIADLVDAETEGQRRQALRQMQGGLALLYDGWRSRLLSALALLDAEIDFPDEDLPHGVASRAAPIVAALADDMANHLADSGRGERVRDGYRIAIIGPPNAGKSSLLNALARREAAIVSDVAGTTRDVVEVRLVLAGFAVWIADTAGLREARDAIESEGVKRALARAEDADLRIGVSEAGAPVEARLADALRAGDILVRSKADLRPALLEADLEADPAADPAADPVADPGPGAWPGRAAGLAPTDDGRPLGLPPGQDLHLVSVRSGTGMAALDAALSARVARDLAHDEAPALTRARHRTAVIEAERALRRADPSMGAELAAEDVRLAARAIGRLTGRIDVEDVLGEIFASFCIGK